MGAGSRFDLPEICIVTGERLGVEWHKRDFYYHPPWILVLVILNILI